MPRRMNSTSYSTKQLRERLLSGAYPEVVVEPQGAGAALVRLDTIKVSILADGRTRMTLIGASVPLFEIDSAVPLCEGTDLNLSFDESPWMTRVTIDREGQS